MGKQTILRGVFMVSALLGFALIFLGVRFLITPEAAEQSFGLRFNEAGDYAFHMLKGIRDLFAGIVILTFAILGQPRLLALVLGWNIVIPLADMLVVAQHPYAIAGAALIHGMSAVVLLIVVVTLVVVDRSALVKDASGSDARHMETR